MRADFSGYATKAGLKCTDGRTIMPNAFEHQDKMTVPLVWQHGHKDPKNVLGHAVLENRPDGVYAHGYFNDTEQGQGAKQLVAHGDITSLSIYANQLVEKAKQVFHGAIREVSLVLAGANPGAKIDFVAIQHADGSEEDLEDEAIIYTGLELQHADGSEEDSEDVEHAADAEETIQDIYESFSDKQKDVVHFMIGAALEAAQGNAVHSDLEEGTVQDVYDSLSDQQKEVVHFMIGAALEASDEAANTANNEGSMAHQEGTDMTNVFEQDALKQDKGPKLNHADQASIFEQAKKMGSLTDAVQHYALSHGIEDIDTLFPDAQAVTSTPEWYKRRTEWVASVLDGTHHTPFAKIKSLSADLTPEEARAKGYIKGNLKREEFFKVSKRVTGPQTVYKKQKLDRDDILDITDFDVVMWLKGEMRIMLDEEIARAILIGDGRSIGDEDKIKEEHIRPIATDDEFYATTIYVNIDDAESSADEIVDALTLQRHHYRGSGMPSFFTSETILAKMLLAKDGMNRRLYASVQELESALRVSKIIPVEVMENQGDLVGIMVNLKDYNVGTNKGGDVSLFDDFDIDYNQFKYLIETRLSGALVKPKSALVVRKVAASSVLVTPVSPAFDGNTVTVATTTGVTYKNKLTDATLTTGVPVELADGESITVIAVPASSAYFFANDADDEWTFTENL